LDEILEQRNKDGPNHLNKSADICLVFGQ